MNYPHPCVYRLDCGDHFYIGSTSNLTKRHRDHVWRLKKGIHPNPKLQAAFDQCGEARSQHVAKVPEGDNLLDRLRAIEQEKLNFMWGNPLLCNQSPNARGPNNTEYFKNKWENPEFREKMTAFLQSRKGVKVTAETRQKMAAAKAGANNHSARPVIVTAPDGTTSTFDCGTSAAKFFRVSQQLFHTWLTGKAPWPGTGKITRFQNQWIAPYKAEFVTTNANQSLTTPTP